MNYLCQARLEAQDIPPTVKIGVPVTAGRTSGGRLRWRTRAIVAGSIDVP